MSDALRAIRQALRAVRAEMKDKHVKRMSFMNGGHTPESYRLNSKVFELETRLKALTSTK